MARVSALTPDDIPRLRERWRRLFEPLFVENRPASMPPWREVSHTIPLIDDNAQYKYHIARCPEYLREQLLSKMRAEVPQ